jgi:2-polyprenyl-3-methyl-5-hydroxy-6-metoxy-1,4-benzoquinol methylase
LTLRIKDIVHQDTEHCTIDVDHKISDSLCVDGLHDDGCLFVISKNGALEGIITDGDIRRVLKKNIDISEVLIKDVMTTQFLSAYEESSLVEAYQLMATEEINHLPIVNSKKVLTGFIVFHELAARLSPEHLLIDLGEEFDRPDNEERHIQRYKFASNFIGPNDRVLDGACGSGYGSEIMSSNGAKVTGIDANHEAIKFANQHYAKSSVEFMVGEIGKLEFPDASFDVIVSIETLEHLPNASCRKYLQDIGCWLKKGGVLIASSPMLRYRDGKPYVTNPYHINEMPRPELLAMFQASLPTFVFQLFYQDQTRFLPLLDEHSGFCILVARKAN